MRMAYNCKFCQRPGFVEFDDNPVSHAAAEKWFPALCCDRCGDFRVNIRNVRIGIAVTCRDMLLKKKNCEPRPALERLTKKLCSIACDHHRLQNVYESEFVDMLIEKPMKHNVIVSTYLNGLARIAKP